MGACVLFWLLAAMAAWDYNDRQHEQKMESMLIFDSIQAFHETGDPLAISYRYVGSTKTKVFHFFVSDCAKEIRSTNLRGFKSRKDAVEAGYSRCTVCRP